MKDGTNSILELSKLISSNGMSEEAEKKIINAIKQYKLGNERHEFAASLRFELLKNDIDILILAKNKDLKKHLADVPVEKGLKKKLAKYKEQNNVASPIPMMGRAETIIPDQLKMQAEKKELLELFKKYLIESKTPHIFHAKIRDFAQKKYEEDEKKGILYEDRVESIRELLSYVSTKLDEEYLDSTKLSIKLDRDISFSKKKDHLKVLRVAARDYMQNRFPPNIGYSDNLVSVTSKEESVQTLETVSPPIDREVLMESGPIFETAHIITRGIGYKTSQFGQSARTWHRSFCEGSITPNYSIAAAKIAIERYNHKNDKKIGLNNFFSGELDHNQEFKKIVTQVCKEISDDFKIFRDEEFRIKVRMPEARNNRNLNTPVEQLRTEEKNLLPIFILQDVYTNDMAVFRMLINKEARKKLRENYKTKRHPFGDKESKDYKLNKNGVLATMNPESVMQLINLLDGQKLNFHEKYNDLSIDEQMNKIEKSSRKKENNKPHMIDYKDNPFTSTGYQNEAAYDYSIENKTYGKFLLQEFFPNYDEKLVPQHPYMGKYYSYMMTEEEYKTCVADSALNVMKEHEAGNINIHPNIHSEVEMTFIGGCLIEGNPQISLSKYPKFKKEWGDLTPKEQKDLKKKYNYDNSTYDKTRTALREFNNPDKNPAYLRLKFVEAYTDLLNTHGIKKNTTDGGKWTKENVLALIAYESLDVDGLESTLKSYGIAEKSDSKECIKILNEYKENKKEFHKLFEPMYEHMMKQYERESIDLALKKGLRIENLSDEGKKYQDKKITQLTKRVHPVTLSQKPRTKAKAGKLSNKNTVEKNITSKPNITKPTI